MPDLRGLRALGCTSGVFAGAGVTALVDAATGELDDATYACCPNPGGWPGDDCGVLRRADGTVEVIEPSVGRPRVRHDLQKFHHGRQRSARHGTRWPLRGTVPLTDCGVADPEP